jgi:hypothetical protein
VLFAWLRGEIRTSRVGGVPSTINDTELAGATVSVTISAAYPDGDDEEPWTFTVPLQTTAYNDIAHLAMRDSAGAHVGSLNVIGPNDILFDMWILGQFIRAGIWTFSLEAELADGRNLFALTLTQHLNGELRMP